MSTGRLGTQAREIYTIARHQDGWAVEHQDGGVTDVSSSREEVQAAATRLARAANDAGRSAQINTRGEAGFYQPTAGVARR